MHQSESAKARMNGSAQSAPLSERLKPTRLRMSRGLFRFREPVRVCQRLVADIAVPLPVQFRRRSGRQRLRDHLAVERRTLWIHPAALEEAEAATQWYAQRSGRAAGRFLDEPDAAVDQISRNPGQYTACDLASADWCCGVFDS